VGKCIAKNVEKCIAKNVCEEAEEEPKVCFARNKN
jgi:hypothetical protein